MQNPATSDRYTAIAIGFHWLLAVLILGTLGFGLYMVDLPFSPARVKQYNWHKWAGITILLLSALRLLWRLTHKPPADNPAWSTWQALASHWVHRLLYLLFFAVPLAGWAYSSAVGFPVVWFGVVPLPDWVSPNPELAKTLKVLHRYLAYSLAAIVYLHILAVLKHHFIDKDGLLNRMR